MAALSPRSIVATTTWQVMAGVQRGEEPREVGLVLGEEELGRRGLCGQPETTERGVLGDQPARPVAGDPGLRPVPLLAGAAPRPGVAEPERGEQVERRGRGAPVGDGDAHQDVLGSRLGVLDEHVEVAILGEDPGVEQLELRLEPVPVAVPGDERLVGERRLRVLVEVLHVRMGRGAVEVEVILLDVLSVVPLAVGQAEEALLQDRVGPVPEGEPEAQ